MDNHQDNQRKIAVFGGSRVARESEQYAEAYEVGRRLAQAGMAVVNGGYSGSMEASAKGAREAGGRVIGVTSAFFARNEMNPFIDEEIPTDDLYNRIRHLVVRSDGYIVLRGSIGTLAELLIVWNIATIDPHFNRPIILLGEPWKNVIRALQENLAIAPEHFQHLTFAATPEECIEHLKHELEGRPPVAWQGA
ncbi:MAG: LOG family protein [Anaerolineae bacterium]